MPKRSAPGEWLIVNDELRNIAQVEHSGHRSLDNFIVNMLGAIAAYCMFPKKQCFYVQRTIISDVVLFVNDYCSRQNSFVYVERTYYICNYFGQHMEKKQSIVIHIPENLSHLQVQVLRNSNQSQLIFALQSESESYVEDIKKKYVFVWRQQDYVKVMLDDILWVKADKSYSCIHLRGGKTMTISSNLSSVEERLPADDFLRIHRSCLVNLRHVASLMGNCLKVEGEYFVIGREYRESVLDRFIFLGVKRKKPK